MIRVMMFLAAVLVAAVGLSWLSDNPGTVSIYWPALNLKADPTVFQVIIGLTVLVAAALLGWSLVRQIWNSPAAVGSLMNRRDFIPQMQFKTELFDSRRRSVRRGF